MVCLVAALLLFSPAVNCRIEFVETKFKKTNPYLMKKVMHRFLV